MSRHYAGIEHGAFGREILCDWLERQGFNAASSPSLPQALAAIQKTRPLAETRSQVTAVEHPQETP
jgi:hypothetical protein